MKYDILTSFREYLNSEIENKNTADRYYFAVTRLFKQKQFDSLDEIDLDYLKSSLLGIKTKNDFSAAKNGLLHLAAYDQKLALPEEEFFSGTSLKKRNWTKKPAKTLYLDTINRKTNSIKNKSLKLAYRLMKASGLRVSEVAALEKQDIEIDRGQIKITVKHGKGGSNGIVTCLPDNYLAKELKIYLDQRQENEQIFYSAASMKKYAGELGIECHDFRRIAAITHNTIEKKTLGNDKETANEHTKDFLRHSRFSTTKRYLYNRKLKFKHPDVEE